MTFLAISILLLLVIGWHFIFPLLGGVIIISSAIWIAIIASVVGFSIAILLLFIFSGIGLILLTVGAIIAAIIGIFLFPILFPILIPLLIILAVIAYNMRRKKQKEYI